MSDVLEFVFWGRGGEGAKTASHVLAEAAFIEGKNVQAFPEYGPERSGAPMRAFVKISEGKIPDQSMIVNPNYIVFIDGSLLSLQELNSQIFQYANKDTKFFINSKEQVKLENNYESICLDASSIAQKYIGKDFVNILMLGAIVKLTKVVKLESLIEAVKRTLSNKPNLIEANIKALKEAYNAVNG